MEEEHDILKNRLLGDLNKKRVLELEITRRFEQLKKIEISMEKNSHESGQGKIGSRFKSR
jgi:hypothetical protein